MQTPIVITLVLSLGSAALAQPAQSAREVVGLRQMFAKFAPPKQLDVETERGKVVVRTADYYATQNALRAADVELTAPDVVTVEGVKVPYYATWKAQTNGGKKLGLTPWAAEQAKKYGVSVKSLQAAVAADWTRQGRERDRNLAEIREAFARQHGASLVEVTRALHRLRSAFEKQVVADVARRHGIRDPRLTSWGPAGSSLGIAGTINGKPVLFYNGRIYRDGQHPRNAHTRCLPPEALIATPDGEVALRELREGDLVMTLDSDGRRVSAPVLLTSATVVATTHWMVHLTLADGRRVRVSPGHPAARRGTTMGDWRVGEELDGSIVVERTVAEYDATTTQDILPGGDTHLYWADGILMGSTLATATPEDE